MGASLGTWYRRQQPVTTPVYDTYWAFACHRQDIYHRRVEGSPGPWTTDPVLSAHRFTNAYRAADRVSQYLIRHVAYDGEQSPDEVFFRIILFKLFNRVSTWELLTTSIGGLSADTYDVERCGEVLDAAFADGQRLYSAAYIMPAASRGADRKHRTHLELLGRMLDDRMPKQLAESPSMRDAYLMLLGYGGIGPFLAYQLVTDLNYSSLMDFSEMDFVQAGPGARSGLRKCFSSPGEYSDEDLIRWVADRQCDELARRGLHFKDLWGRPLQLIDCQNLFCEVDKYARVAHPDVAGIGERTRIKQRFQSASEPISVWFPPNWGLNERLPSLGRQDNRSSYQIDLDDPTAGSDHASPDLIASQDRLFPVM